MFGLWSKLRMHRRTLEDSIRGTRGPNNGEGRGEKYLENDNIFLQRRKKTTEKE